MNLATFEYRFELEKHARFQLGKLPPVYSGIVSYEARSVRLQRTHKLSSKCLSFFWLAKVSQIPVPCLRGDFHPASLLCTSCIALFCKFLLEFDKEGWTTAIVLVEFVCPLFRISPLFRYWRELINRLQKSRFENAPTRTHTFNMFLL